MISMEQLKIKNIRLRPYRDLEKDLEWFCESLGIIGDRDKNKTALKIFKIFLEKYKNGEKTTINEIKEKTNLSRTAVVHHLKYLEASGIIVGKRRDYELRRECLEKVVEEIEKDALRVLEEIKEMAKEIDEGIGINFRKKQLKFETF